MSELKEFRVLFVVLIVAAGVALYAQHNKKVQAADASDVYRLTLADGGPDYWAFEKDRGGRRSERLIAVHGNVGAIYNFFCPEAGECENPEVFVDYIGAPQDRRRVENIPRGIRYYWEFGRKTARDREPGLFSAVAILN